jgi:hypothetical protein
MIIETEIIKFPDRETRIDNFGCFKEKYLDKFAYNIPIKEERS